MKETSVVSRILHREEIRILEPQSTRQRRSINTHVMNRLCMEQNKYSYDL